MHDALINTVVAERYRLTKVVGRGGMGVVYRADDLRLNDRPCAVKLLLRASKDAEEDARFERELKIITLMRSRHVVQVLDTGLLDSGRRFIVMELLEGYTLSDLVKQGGALSASRTAGIARGILAGLAEAHEHGVVHRDLKPANIFICRTRAGDEVAKILDFGIAKESNGGGVDLTAASMLIGTPKYMAPEQFLKKTATPQTDLYSVGLLIYEMLDGEPPFTRRSLVPESIKTMPDEFRVGWLHVNQQPVPVGVTHSLWPIIRTLLSKDPEERYGSAEEVLDAIGTAWHRQAPPPPPLLNQALIDDRDPSASASFPVAGETLGMAQVPAARSWGRWVVAAAIVGSALAAALNFATTGGEETAAAVRAPVLCRHLLSSVPPRAKVIKGIQTLGETTMAVERPCEETWLLKISKKGYAPLQYKLSGRKRLDTAEIELKPLGDQAPSITRPPPTAVEQRPTRRRGSLRAAPKSTPARASRPTKTVRTKPRKPAPRRVAPQPKPRPTPATRAKPIPKPAATPAKTSESNALPF